MHVALLTVQNVKLNRTEPNLDHNVEHVTALDEHQRVITTAITQVAANKLKIKTDVKCDLGSSHCYVAIALRLSYAIASAI